MPQVNMKILLFVFLCFFLQKSFAKPVDIGEAKDQVFNLLNIIDERNEVLRERMSNDEAVSRSDTIREKDEEIVNNDVGDSYAYINGVRDPFSATKIIIDASRDDSSLDGGDGAYSGYDFKSPGLAVKLPKLSLKGVVYKSSKSDPLALLDVSGHGVYMVRLEDEIGFSSADPSQVIKIKKINRLNIVVEVGTLGDLIVVR